MADLRKEGYLVIGALHLVPVGFFAAIGYRISLLQSTLGCVGTSYASTKCWHKRLPVWYFTFMDFGSLSHININAVTLLTRGYGGRGQKFGVFLAMKHSVNSKAFIRLRFRSV